MKTMPLLLTFLPASLANDPLGLFLLIGFSFLAMASLIIFIGSLILP